MSLPSSQTTSTRHQDPINIYNANVAPAHPPPASPAILAKYVFTQEINREENETIQDV